MTSSLIIFTKKIPLILSMFFFSIILSGCLGFGGSSTNQTVGFEGFELSIDDTFVPVANGLVENKQIINKVIKSFKVENEEGFDTNFIITKSIVAPELNYEQFRTVNTDKLRSYIQSYTPGKKEIISFSCGEKEIKGILIDFTIQDSFYQHTDMYYMSQYQFVANETGYILSHASATKSDQDTLKTWIKTLACTSE